MYLHFDTQKPLRSTTHGAPCRLVDLVIFFQARLAEELATLLARMGNGTLLSVMFQTDATLHTRLIGLGALRQLGAAKVSGDGEIVELALASFVYLHTIHHRTFCITPILFGHTKRILPLRRDVSCHTCK